MNAQFEDFIGIFDDAFSEEYCQTVIKAYNSHKENFGFSRQQLENHDKLNKDDTAIFTGNLYNDGGIDVQHFHNLIGNKFHENWQNCYDEYVKEYSILNNFSEHGIYCNKVQETKAGQGYHVWHTENMNKGTCQRIGTYILYLNDIEEGGETEFLYYKKRVKPKTGRLVIFPAGMPHVHRGNPPLDKDKYIITGWIEY